MVRVEDSQERSIAFVVFDGMKMLDVAGPAEVFSEANQFGANYGLSYVSVSGDAVTTSVGTLFAVSGPVQLANEAHTVIVSGGDDLVSKPIPTDLVEAVTAGK